MIQFILFGTVHFSPMPGILSRLFPSRKKDNQFLQAFEGYCVRLYPKKYFALVESDVVLMKVFVNNAGNKSKGLVGFVEVNNNQLFKVPVAKVLKAMNVDSSTTCPWVTKSKHLAIKTTKLKEFLAAGKELAGNVSVDAWVLYEAMVRLMDAFDNVGDIMKSKETFIVVYDSKAPEETEEEVSDSESDSDNDSESSDGEEMEENQVVASLGSQVISATSEADIVVPQGMAQFCDRVLQSIVDKGVVIKWFEDDNGKYYFLNGLIYVVGTNFKKMDSVKTVLDRTPNQETICYLESQGVIRTKKEANGKFGR